jgi:hypothetical protein
MYDVAEYAIKETWLKCTYRPPHRRMVFTTRALTAAALAVSMVKFSGITLV